MLFVKKYYNTEMMKNQMAKEAEITALVAMKQLF
jgi:propionyl-CoA carboxylase alpha chain